MKKTITALAAGFFIGIVIAYISAILVDKTLKTEFYTRYHNDYITPVLLTLNYWKDWVVNKL
jgi:capsular polysaccharide biosynthesis protein